MPDTDTKIFVRQEASKVIAQLGKDRALDFLFMLLIKSVNKVEEFAALTPDELQSNQLITIGIIWEVMKYTQIA